MESAARQQVQVCVLVVYRSNGAGDKLKVLVEKSIVSFCSDLLDGLRPYPSPSSAILVVHLKPFPVGGESSKQVTLPKKELGDECRICFGTKVNRQYGLPHNAIGINQRPFFGAPFSHLFPSGPAVCRDFSSLAPRQSLVWPDHDRL